MSRKSRQPDKPTGAKGAKGSKGQDKKAAKGKKGKKGQPVTGQRQLVVESQPEGVPFAIVVLLAAVMSMPSVANYVAGGLAFDALMVRVMAALAVSWLLSQLVYAVFEAMRPPEVTAIVELPPEEAFEAVSRQGALTGTIVDDDGFDAEGDPFALDPIEPVEAAPLPEAGTRDEPAA